MSTYSTNLKIELIGTGEQVGTWGSTTNSNFANVFEQAIVGQGTVNFPTDADVTMTFTDSVASQTARNVYLNLTSSGSLSVTRQLVVPTINKNYVIQNNTTGGQSITVKTVAGTGITVPNGFTCALYVDGTNVIQAFDFLPTLTIGALNVTTLDLTNLEVTNIKAKDGTASASIADSTGAFTVSAPFAANGGTTIGDASGDAFTINSSAVSIPNGLTVSGGTTTFNNNQVISVTDNSNAALRITQLGTGNALLVEDSSNPDATPFVIDSSGLCIQGSTSFVNTPNYAGTASSFSLQTLGTITSGTGYVGHSFGMFNNSTAGAGIFAVKSRSGTVGGQTVVNANDKLFAITTAGSDGTNFIRAADISFEVDGTPGTNDMPGRLVFSTTADGASSPTERMRIRSDGGIGIGGAGSTATQLNVSGTLVSASNVSRAFSNTASAPTTSTAEVTSFWSQPSTADGITAVSNVFGFIANQGTITGGTRVTPTNQYGFNATSSLTGATNNYGFYSNIASGTGRWNFYANGTAANYFGGAVSTGSTISAFSDINAGAGISTADAAVNVGINRTASGFAYLDLIGDTTYSDYGLRVIRNNTGANTSSQILHRGTGEFRLNAQEAAPILFSTTNLERMRITSTGNVGIGTSSPQARLQARTDAPNATSYAILTDNGDASGGTQVAGIGFSNAGSMKSSITAAVYNNDFMAFNVGGGGTTERMRIDSSGNLLIGTTTLNDPPTTNGFSFTPNTGGFSGVSRLSIAGNSTSSSQYPLMIRSTANNTWRFYIDYAGNIYAQNTSITSLSDVRLKENIRDLETGLNTVLALQPRRFDWKEGKGQDKKDVAGFIAQEVEPILPEMVSTGLEEDADGNKYKTLAPGMLIPTLVKAIQEQQAIITDLKARIETLESR